MMMIRMVSVRTMIEMILMLMMAILVIMTKIANSKDRVSVNEKLYYVRTGSAKDLYACIYWKKWRFGRVSQTAHGS